MNFHDRDPHTLRQFRRSGALIVCAHGITILAAGLFALLEPKAALSSIIPLSGSLLLSSGILGVASAMHYAPTLNLGVIEAAKSAFAIFVGFLILESPEMNAEAAAYFVVSSAGMFLLLTGLLGAFLYSKFGGTNGAGLVTISITSTYFISGLLILMYPPEIADFLRICSSALIGFATLLLARGYWMFRSL